MPLLQLTDKGLYCAQGDFYVDPWRSVHKAVITHAHSDHAKAGHQAYLCHHLTKPLLKARLGNYSYESLSWNEPVYINGVKVSLHPAGHVIGSSQIRIEKNGEVWVVSGDYKTYDDGLSGLFEPVRCDTFITESTFGLPVYQWQTLHEQYHEVQQWVQRNQSDNIHSVLFAYSLGKAQRMIQAVADINPNIFVHGSVWTIDQALREVGIQLPPVKRISKETDKNEFKNAVIIAPMSTMDSPWLKQFSPYKTAVCSGWMHIRGQARRNQADTGFAISDHADWNGLLLAIDATKAERVLVTHGYSSVLSKYLNEKGIEARVLETSFGEDDDN
jgi:putative mRNA 3-end processing factor